MKVKELRRLLETFDGEDEVVYWYSDEVGLPVRSVTEVLMQSSEDYELQVPRREWQLGYQGEEAKRAVMLVPDPEALAAQRRVGYGWDIEWLRQKYWDQGLTLAEIADLIGSDAGTLSRVFGRLGIETRGTGRRWLDLGVSCDDLAEWYHGQGMSLVDMGERLHISHEWVRQEMERCDIERRPPHPPRIRLDCESLREQYEELGMTQAEIAEDLGVSSMVVSRERARCGIETQWSRTRAISADCDELKELYWDQELTLAEIADDLGVSSMTVYRAMVGCGIDRRTTAGARKRVRLDCDEVNELYWDEGLTLEGVAEQVGHSSSLVHREMVRCGIPRRNPGRAKGEHRIQLHCDELNELYWDDGLTLREIGGRLGCSSSTIRQVMIRCEIDRRRPGYTRGEGEGHDEDSGA